MDDGEVDDGEVVAALRARDAESLTAIHDAYAAPLYDYALGILPDREAAEDAVHDALLVALDRIGGLREPSRVRVWLYALTRNECLRQARRSRVASRPQRVDARDETIYFRADDLAVEQARAWIRDAAAGLPPDRREALDLTVRHGLTEDDLATVLGVTVNRAAARVTAARRDLDRALDSLLTARAGRGHCARLDQLLDGWDGRFDQVVHERVSAHTATCASCAADAPNRDGAVDRFAELPPAQLPATFRGRLANTATVPDRVAYRGEVAEPFLRSGFPVPLHGYQRRRRALWAAAAAGVLLLTGATWYSLLPENQSGGGRIEAAPGIQELAPPSPVGPSATPSTSPNATTSASPSASPTPSGSRSPSATPSSAPASAVPTPGTLLAADPSIQVDGLLADTTVGCPPRWKGTATGYVRGTEPRSVTFVWGENPAPNRPVAMIKKGDGIWQTTVTDLPPDVTVFWRVVVITADGATAASEVSSSRHQQC